MLQKVNLTKNNALNSKHVNTVLAKYRGQKITSQLIESLLLELNFHMQENGFINSLVFLPDQQVKRGAIALRVLEGVLSKVNYNEKDSKFKNSLQKVAREIIKIKPFNADKAEELMAHLQALPGVRLSTRLNPDPKTQGASVMTLAMQQQKRFFGDVSATKIGDTPKLAASFGVNNLLYYSVTTINGGFSPTKDFNYIVGARHQQYLSDKGASVTLSFSHNVSDAKNQYEETLTPLLVTNDLGIDLPDTSPVSTELVQRSTTYSYELNTDVPLINYSTGKWKLKGGVSYRYDKREFSEESEADTKYGFLVGEVGTTVYKTWPYFTVNLFATAAKSLWRNESLGDVPEGIDESFFKFFGGGELELKLPFDFSIRNNLLYQYTTNRLPTGESATLGYSSIGRGFGAGQVSGDKAYGNMITLSKDISFAKAPYVSFNLFAGYDWGEAWQNDSDVVDSTKFSSLGFGVGVSTTIGLDVNLHVGYPLTTNDESLKDTLKTFSPRLDISWRF